MVDEDGAVFAWGRDQFQQCGVAAPYRPYRYIESPRHVALPVRVLEVSAGKQHSLFVAFDGSLYSCGRGEGGRLGHGDLNDRSTPHIVESLRGRHVLRAAAGGDHSVVIIAAAAIVAASTAGEGSASEAGPTICGLRVDPQPAGGELWTFGGDQSGQLGLGRGGEDKLTPTRVCALRHERIVDVAAGEQFTIIVVESGQLYAFGWNGQGQLGLGTGQAAARLPAVVDLPPASAAGGYWEMRPQWTVHFSFYVALRRPERGAYGALMNGAERDVESRVDEPD